MFEQFRSELPCTVGGDRLAYIPVYHDFNWEEVFSHNLPAFPNGKCLAHRVKKECPDGKSPALILTIRDDAHVMPVETDTHYAVVVKIKDYLSNPNYDPSASYFASASQIQLTKSGLLKQIMDNPELVSQIVDSSLTIEMIGTWAAEVPERLLQLKQLIYPEDITSTGGESETTVHVNLENVIDILQWFAETNNVESLLSKLAELNAHDLNKITSVVGVANLQKVLEIWNTEKQNGSEDFWQDIFTSNPWVISQLFSCPVVIMTDKAYVGGKAINNIGGNIVDFLYQNQLTTNVILVEIKTPTTNLLSSKYRDNVFSISNDLSGAVNQVLNYREEIEKSFYALSSKPGYKYDVINPKCLLVIGSLENEQFDETQKKSFEMFRSDLKSVEIVTYDELFTKIHLLVELLQEP